jgi:hypothetical protein
MSFAIAIFDEAFMLRPAGRQALAELPQHPLRAQPRQRLLTQYMCTVTTPWAFVRMPHKARSHRVEVDVAYELQEIPIRSDQYRRVAALKQVAYPLVPPIDSARITERHILYDFR